MRIFLLAIFLQGCSFVPVFEGDYLRFQGEVKNQLEETKQKISENAGVLHTVQNMDKETAVIVTGQHAQSVGKWASESVEFTPPSMGVDMINMIVTAILAATGLGGVGVVRKISALKNTVKAVAVMTPEEGVAEAKRRGVVV